MVLRIKDMPDELKKRRIETIGVLGFARTGTSVAKFLTSLGVRVYVSEQKNRDEITDMESLIYLEAQGVRFDFGGHNLDLADQVDLVVVSPGIPKDKPIFSILKARDIPVISEIELASWFFKGKIIGVTGSNGKSTTVSLVHHILKTAGINSHLVGNIGNPFVSLVHNGLRKKSEQNGEMVVVLELSSFQLDDIMNFKPNSGIILNITPDHLDRYKDLEEYKLSKLRIFENMTTGDRAVINRIDPIQAEYSPSLGAEVINIIDKSSAYNAKPDETIYILDGMKVYRIKEGKEEVLVSETDELPLLGPHNRLNILASWALIADFNLPLDVIKNALYGFTPLPHRMEICGVINGVKYVNDSKATNPASLEVALLSFKDNSIILIAGGYDKHNDFTPLNELINEKCKYVLCIGEVGKSLVKTWSSVTQTEYLYTLSNALNRAHQVAYDGDVVLLSPGCASFDQFNNFEERGMTFINLVKELTRRKDAQA